MKDIVEFAQLFSVYNRSRKLKFLLDYIKREKIESCLVVGAIPRSNTQDYQNLIEEGILQRLNTVVFSGLEVDGQGWPSWVQADGCDLPFGDQKFDLVFSNAVVEHVGDIHRQKIFVQEHNRVGTKFMLTTPYRLFPVESHTQTLFRHMSGSWTDASFARLLSKSDLRELLPPQALIRGGLLSPTFIAFN